MSRLALRLSIMTLCWLSWGKQSLGQDAAPPAAAAPRAPAAEPVPTAPPAAPGSADATPTPTTDAPIPASAPITIAAPLPPAPSAEPGAQPTAAAKPAPTAASAQPAAAPGATGAEQVPDPAHSDDSFEGDPWGDEPASLVAGPLSLKVLLQTRYAHTFAADSSNARIGYALREDVLLRDGDGFSLQRFFFRMAADPSPLLGFKAILDFSKLRGSDVSNVLKQAYGTLRPIPKRLEIAAGVFKLPFSILELDPVARYELSSLGDADDFIKELGFAGRDVGVEVMVAPLSKPKHLRLILGAFRGHAKDEHASPLGAVGARVESKPWKALRVGLDVVGMPRSANYKQPFETSSKDVLPMPPDPLYPREQRFDSGKAYSADVTFSHKHFTLRAEGMLGDRIDIDTRYGARSFWAAWALVSYRFRAGPVRLLPAARIEWMDADRDHSVGRRRLITLGVNVLFTKTIRFVIDVTHTDVEGNTPVLEQPQPLAVFPYLDLDSTRVVAQLQLEI
jgi:hypothetical protein